MVRFYFFMETNPFDFKLQGVVYNENKDKVGMVSASMGELLGNQEPLNAVVYKIHELIQETLIEPGQEYSLSPLAL